MKTAIENNNVTGGFSTYSDKQFGELDYFGFYRFASEFYGKPVDGYRNLTEFSGGPANVADIKIVDPDKIPRFPDLDFSKTMFIQPVLYFPCDYFKSDEDEQNGWIEVRISDDIEGTDSTAKVPIQ
ncbi:MAG: hypothetical protein NTX61_16705 [Bacteroidetes bacterium]|nr:hypothetical protein [Bacteroidota bacterium]